MSKEPLRRITNALTIDVEDYFHVTSFAAYVKKEEWEKYPPRVVDDTLAVLDLLDGFSLKATFFVLGWVAGRFPSLVKEISRRGHEIASHGYSHQLVYNLSAGDFRKDIRDSKKILEDISGNRVTGYRAPSYSVTGASLWALDILIEEGFLYDSSIFPIIHDVYGIPGAERFPHVITRPAGTIKEFPISTFEIRCMRAGWRIPIAGGGYLRFFPAGLIKMAIDHINQKEKKPVVLYFHPWEIDPGQKRIRTDPITQFRHYFNLNKMLDKIKVLLSGLDLAPMKNILENSDMTA